MHYKRKGHRGRSKKQGRIGANACRDAGNSASKGLFSWTTEASAVELSAGRRRASGP